MDFPAGHALRDSIALLIDKRLGAHRDSVPFGAGGVRGLEGGKMWSGPGTSVVVATESVGKVASKQGKAVSNEEEELPTPSVHAATGKTFAVAYAPGSGAQDFDLWDARYKGQAPQRAEDQQSLYRNVDSALTWAALPAVTTDLKTVLVFLRTRDVDKPGDLRPPQVDVALLRAIKAINTRRTITAGTRAEPLRFSLAMSLFSRRWPPLTLTPTIRYREPSISSAFRSRLCRERTGIRIPAPGCGRPIDSTPPVALVAQPSPSCSACAGPSPAPARSRSTRE